MAAKKKRQAIEWVGGLVSMPAIVTDEAEPYRPEMLFWMSAEGAILGHGIGRPGELVASAAQSLRDTIARPIVGKPHAPQRVRVASSELAVALRDGVDGLEVVCAPTPELDAVLASMREVMGAHAETNQTYLSAGIEPEAVGAYFRAAAGLFRAAPWTVVPGDEDLVSVTIESLDVRDAVLSVIGQMGRSFGFIVFASLDDFVAFVDAGDAMQNGEAPTRMPRHLALNFERDENLGAALRDEIATHGWEVAGPSGHPRLVAIDEDLVARPGSARELTIAEAISLALTQLLPEKKALLAAWGGGAPVERTFTVRAHAGDIEVTLRVPLERRTALSTVDLRGALRALSREGSELDDDGRAELEDELVRRFAESPEAQSLSDVGWCRFVMDYGADYFGATIATLEPSELREVVFEIIPRKVSVDASEAASVIDELRAFYAFAGRELGLEQADACLRVLAGDAVARLEDALSDASNFGMAKSLLAGGREAGFDMDSKEGIESWLKAIEGKPLPASFRLPSLGAAQRPVQRAASSAKKDKRKAARKARKKNR